MAHDSGLDDETIAGGTPDDYDDHFAPCCKICGGDMEHVDCWSCHGDGGFHDCGEDCCCCLDKEEITVDCQECNGDGSYWECASLPHTDEQMAAYRAKSKPA